MTWHVLKPFTEIEAFGNPVVSGIETCGREMTVKCVIGSSPLKIANHGGKLIQCFRIEPKYLADLTSGQPSTISNNVCRHGRAELPISLIHILDCLFTVFTAGQIHVDVRPLAAFFG